MVAIHRFLSADEAVDVENPATSKWQLDFDTLAQDGIKTPNTKDLVPRQVRIQCPEASSARSCAGWAGRKRG